MLVGSAAILERDRHEVGRVGRARAVVPGAVHEPAALDRHRGAERRPPRRRAELAVGAERVDLRLLGEERRHLQHVCRGETEAPAARRAAARDRHDHARERRHVELVTAEASRLEHAVETGPPELLVDLLRVVAARPPSRPARRGGAAAARRRVRPSRPASGRAREPELRALCSMSRDATGSNDGDVARRRVDSRVQMPASFTETHIDVNGVDTAVLTAGEGEPLVFFHGGGIVEGADCFLALAERFRVVVAYHPGFGGTASDPRIDGIEGWVRHYVALLELLGIDEFVAHRPLARRLARGPLRLEHPRAGAAARARVAIRAGHARPSRRQPRRARSGGRLRRADARRVDLRREACRRR